MYEIFFDDYFNMLILSCFSGMRSVSTKQTMTWQRGSGHRITWHSVLPITEMWYHWSTGDNILQKNFMDFSLRLNKNTCQTFNSCCAEFVVQNEKKNKNTVRCCLYRGQFSRKPSQKHPIAHPLGWGMGCLLWVHILIYRCLSNLSALWNIVLYWTTL